MPVIIRKTVDQLVPGDIPYVDIGNLVKTGVQKETGNIITIDEKGVSVLKEKSPVYIPVIAASPADKSLPVKELGKKLQAMAAREESKKSDHFFITRNRLKENIKSIYIPYKEDEFREKTIPEGKLLEPRSENAYHDEFHRFSVRQFDTTLVSYTKEFVRSLYNILSKLRPRTRENLKYKNIIPQLHLEAVQLPSKYENGKLSRFGDETIWQAVDMAVHFLLTLVNTNKIRTLQECPMSEARFDPDRRTDVSTKFCYPDDFLVDAAVGASLSNIGLSHKLVNRMISGSMNRAMDQLPSKQHMRMLRRQHYAASHLLSDRDEISSISRMLVRLRYCYPDGSGYPPVNENKYLHEFVRLLQVAADYYDMTRPVIFKDIFNRFDVIRYMIHNSGEYVYSHDKFEEGPRYDKEILEGFLAVLAPWAINELVELRSAKTNEVLYECSVHSYHGSYIPLLTVLRDVKADRVYGNNDLLFHLQAGVALVLDSGHVSQKKAFPALKNMIIHDTGPNVRPMQEYRDLLYGEKRKSR